MPRALEPDYEPVIALATLAGDSLTPEQLEWISAFYQNVESRMLNLYEGARLGAWRIYDRSELVAYWLEQGQWFAQQLSAIRYVEDKFRKGAGRVPPALSQTIQTLTEIVALCEGHIEVYA